MTYGVTDVRGTADAPRRSDGVDLLGRADLGGYSRPVWLVCVDGDRYVHATARLYHVLLYADGARPPVDIARRVTEDTGEETTGEQVVALVEQRLRPAGLIAGEEEQARRRPPPQVLAIRHRLTLLPAWLTAPAAEGLQHVYRAPLAGLLVATAAGANGWVLFGPGARAAMQAALAQPAWLRAVLALQVPRGLFLELGHVAALRRAGVRHGAIGLALYTVLPVFFSDVTHAYRLSRAQRIRVDLGGMYFDCLSTVALFAAFLVTGHPALLLAIVPTLLGMLTEFTPFLRLDGYYLLADIVGVPEPMVLLGPLVRDLWPARRRGRRRLELRPAARLVLLGYLAVVVLFLARPALLLAAAGDRVVSAFVAEGARLAADATAASTGHDWARMCLDAAGLVSWSLVPIGLALLSASLLRAAWWAGRALLAPQAG